MKSLFYLLLVFCAPQFWSSGITNASKITIDEKQRGRIDDHMQGIWKLAEDTNFHDYFIVEKDGDNNYVLTYMNRGGNNRGLEHSQAFLIDVSNVKFLALRNWDDNYPGYVFLKIKDVDRGSWNVTAALVIDQSLKDVKGIDELKTLLGKNLNNPVFYGKELHFKKKFEFNSFR